MLRGAQQKGEINYNLHLLTLDKDTLIQSCTDLHTELTQVITELKNNGKNDEDILAHLEECKGEYEKKYEYLSSNLPVAFNSLFTTTDYKLHILLMMLEELYNMGKTGSGGEDLTMKVANALHKEFTDIS
jgi:hypothetical protein